MSAEDLRWLFGIAVTTFLTIVGISVGVFRSLSKSIKDGDDALHERINRVRDEYVRRVDLDERFKHFADMQTEMRNDIKAIRDSLSKRSP